MLLLTVQEWLAFEDDNGDVKVHHDKLKGFVTRLPLKTAIEKLSDYQKNYPKVFIFAKLSFSLIQVSEIEDLEETHMYNMRLELIEDLENVLIDFLDEDICPKSSLPVSSVLSFLLSKL